MQVSWLLDANVFSEYHDELAAAILRNGDVIKAVSEAALATHRDSLRI